MERDKRSDSKGLQTLERWRAAELESAQAQHVQLVRTVTEKESARDRVQSDLSDTQSFVRERLIAAEPLSAESLRQFAQFATLQRQELDVAQSALEESRAHCDEAHAHVVRQFEQLSVVQRLGKRRAFEASKELERSEQKRLDEQALSRLAADRECSVTAKKQERPMAIDAIGALADSTSSVPGNAGIGQEDFLRILLAQLRFQDPLKPVDNQEFVAQLAQFSALEIGRQQSEKVEQLLSMQAADQAVALIGKTVELRTAQGGSTVGNVTAISFRTGEPRLTLTAGGTTLVDVSLADVVLVR